MVDNMCINIFIMFPWILLKFFNLRSSGTSCIQVSSKQLGDTYKVIYRVLSASILTLPQDLEPQFISVTFSYFQIKPLYFHIAKFL